MTTDHIVRLAISLRSMEKLLESYNGQNDGTLKQTLREICSFIKDRIRMETEGRHYSVVMHDSIGSVPLVIYDDDVQKYVGHGYDLMWRSGLTFEDAFEKSMKGEP